MIVIIVVIAIVVGPATKTGVEADAVAHANRDVIEQDVQAFMRYVDAHPERFFMLSGKRESTKRDGTIVPERPGRIMEGRAMKAVRTRLENTARLIYAGIPDEGAGA